MQNKKTFSKGKKLNLQEFNAYLQEQATPKRSTTSGQRSSGNGSGGLRSRLRNRLDHNSNSGSSEHGRGRNDTRVQKGFRSAAKDGFKSKTSARVVKEKLPTPKMDDNKVFPSLCITEDGQAVLHTAPVSLGVWSNGIDTIIAAKDLEPETKSKSTRTCRHRYSSDYSDYSDYDNYSDYEEEEPKRQHHQHSDNKENKENKEKGITYDESDWEDL